MRLKHNADLTHEDAKNWYENYGWHISTEKEGDVTLDAVEYEWLDGTDNEVISKLLKIYDLTDHEAAVIAFMARKVREAAETVVGLLDEAVEAYQRGDLAAVLEVLDKAARVEWEHGDCPATRALRSQLLDDTES
jgi:hypothetical protein